MTCAQVGCARPPDDARVPLSRLDDDAEIEAEAFISTASLAKTMLRLLGGSYGAKETRRRLEVWKLFQPIVLAGHPQQRGEGDDRRARVTCSPSSGGCGRFSRGFYMAGQWVEPGGGAPSAVMSGLQALQLLCAEEKREFSPARHEAAAALEAPPAMSASRSRRRE